MGTMSRPINGSKMEVCTYFRGLLLITEGLYFGEHAASEALAVSKTGRKYETTPELTKVRTHS
jgi:hypothetical protein